MEGGVGIFVYEDAEYISSRVWIALAKESRIYIESMSSIDERSILCDGESTLKSWIFEISEELGFFLGLIDSVGVWGVIEWIFDIIFTVSEGL